MTKLQLGGYGDSKKAEFDNTKATRVGPIQLNHNNVARPVRIFVTADCNVRCVHEGHNDDATSDSAPLQANTFDFLEVPRDHVISVIGATATSGTIFVTEILKTGT